jgi:hypothetical protein
MYGRLIAILVAVTLGLIATVFFFNWLWIRAFGPGVVQQQPTPAQRTEDRKELQAQNAARVAARREREKYSPEILREAARVAAPKALSESEFNPKTGRVRWPELLLASEYESPRGELEQLLQQRATGSLDDEGQAKARTAAEQMRSTLRANIRNLPADDYLAAQRFLESLTHSIQP